MTRIKVATAAVAASVCLHAGWAQEAFNLVPLGGTAAAQSAADSDTVKVQGRGVGIDEVSALKDAYRDAIERAVGLYVDAEQVAKNNELVKDQILTQSNAYITDYQKLSSERIDGGLVQLRILATVKKRALTKRISDVIPAQVISLGQEMQNLHANVATNDKRNKDAAAILKAALEGVDPIRQLVVPTICPETRQLVEGKQAGYWFDEMKYDDNGIPAGKIGFSYVFKLQVNRDKYFKDFVPHLKKVLDQISLSPPKPFRISGLAETENDSRLYFMKDYLKGGEKRNTRGDVEGDCFGFYNPFRAMSGTVDGSTWTFQAFSHAGVFFNSEHDEINVSVAGRSIDNARIEEITQSIFILVTELKSDGSFGKAVQYELDKESTLVLDNWLKACGCSYDTFRNGNGSMNYNIVFLDKSGEEVGVFPWKIPRHVLMNIGGGYFYPRSDKLVKRMNLADNQPVGCFYSSPFVGCAGDTFIQWRDFVLSKDDLARIASVRIEPID